MKYTVLFSLFINLCLFGQEVEFYNTTNANATSDTVFLLKESRPIIPLDSIYFADEYQMSIRDTNTLVLLQRIGGYWSFRIIDPDTVDGRSIRFNKNNTGVEFVTPLITRDTAHYFNNTLLLSNDSDSTFHLIDPDTVINKYLKFTSNGLEFVDSIIVSANDSILTVDTLHVNKVFNALKIASVGRLNTDTIYHATSSTVYLEDHFNVSGVVTADGGAEGTSTNWYLAYVRSNRMVDDTTNWKTAYGWGNHASQNYFDKDDDSVSDISDVNELGEGGAKVLVTDGSGNIEDGDLSSFALSTIESEYTSWIQNSEETDQVWVSDSATYLSKYDASQTYLTTETDSAHTHDSRYYTEAEVDGFNFLTNVDLADIPEINYNPLTIAHDNIMVYDTNTTKFEMVSLIDSLHKLDNVLISIADDNTYVLAYNALVSGDWQPLQLNWYTQTELQTSGSSSIHWNNVTNAPAFITDGNTNWDNSYNLLDKDTDTYVDVEADPIYSAWDKDYNDLTNTPTIPSGNQIIDWAQASQGTIHSTNYSVSLADLAEINYSALTIEHNDVMVYDTNSSKFEMVSLIDSLHKLNDVSISIADDNTYVLAYNALISGDWQPLQLDWYTQTQLQTSGGASVHWDNITNEPTFLTSIDLGDVGYVDFSVLTANDGDILVYNSTGSQFETVAQTNLSLEIGDLSNVTDNIADDNTYILAYNALVDDDWLPMQLNWYTQTELQTSGSASVHWDNVTNEPTFLTSVDLGDVGYVDFSVLSANDGDILIYNSAGSQFETVAQSNLSLSLSNLSDVTIGSLGSDQTYVLAYNSLIGDDWQEMLLSVYTQTELQTSGSSSVHWGNLTNKPTFGEGALANSDVDLLSGGTPTGGNNMDVVYDDDTGNIWIKISGVWRQIQ
jgi:hypothetical protein